MSTLTADVPDREEQLDQILAEFLQDEEAGRPPQRERMKARYPEFAEELDDFFADRAFMKKHTARMGFIVPQYLGDYRLLEIIGQGGMGVVYKAWQVRANRLVAVKMIRTGQLATPQEVERFRREARAAGQLQHPHIVRIYEVSEHEGRHYFSMELIEGGSLTQRLHRCTAAERATRPYQDWVAGLMAKIARAVEHAHQHQFIHRDLKPGNILLDAQEQPHITDLGLAKRLTEGEPLFDLGALADEGKSRERFRWEDGLGADTLLTEEGSIVGTAPYMSPEQAAGQQLRTASDVYSLGIILYEMLTGQVPFRGATPLETIQLVEREVPNPPRSLNPRIDPRLEKICLKCLQRDPADRYGSARGLAANLERWLAKRPLVDPPDDLAVRFRLWCRRHPGLGLLSLTLLVLFLFVTLAAILTTRHRAALLESEVERSNAYAAQGVAGIVLSQWRQYSLPLLEAAGSQELRQLLEEDDRAGLQDYLERTCHAWNVRSQAAGDGAARFQTSRILNREGILLASAPGKADTLGKGYKGKRNYFDGTIEQAERTGGLSVHVSRVFQADADQLFKIALAAPIRDPGRKGSPILGVLTATLTTDPTMGLPQLHDERRKAVLVGRQDTATPTYLILLHPAFRHGEEPVRVANDRLRVILERTRGTDELNLPPAGPGPDAGRASDASYQDPVASRHPEYGGRWLAGFAPVGNTEFAIIVQQRHDEAIPPHSNILWSGAALLLGLLFLLAGAWFVLRSFVPPRAPER